MHCTIIVPHSTLLQLLDMQPIAQMNNSGTNCTQPPYTLTTLYLPLAILAWCALCCSLHIVVLAWGAVNTLSVVPPRAPRLMPQIPRRKPDLFTLKSLHLALASKPGLLSSFSAKDWLVLAASSNSYLKWLTLCPAFIRSVLSDDSSCPGISE